MPTLPDVKGKVVVDDSQLKKATGTTDMLSKALGHFGPVGKIAAQGLSDVSGTAKDVGSALGLAGGVAVAAGAAIAGAAVYAASKYADLVGKIDNYQDVTNSSATEASRAVHMFDVLGVSAESAAGSMFKLSRNIAEGADKLSALGIEIKRGSDGGVNLTETLYSISDAYVAAGDASAKTKILTTAFGRSGAEMIDVVEQGSGRLRELAAATKLVVTDADIERMRNYTIKQQEVKSAWDEWWATLGQKILPIQDAVATSVLRGQYVQEQMNQAVAAGTISYEDANSAVGQNAALRERLITKYEQEFDASQQVTHALAVHNLTLKEQAAALEKVISDTDKSISQLAGQVSAEIAAKRANLDVAASQDKITLAHQAYTTAVKEHGRRSIEARAALDAYRRSVIDQEEAYFRAAEAARKLAQANHATTDEQRDAKGEVDALIKKFEAEARTLAPNSLLRKHLLEYIAMLKSLPVEVSTTIRADYVRTGTGGKGPKAFAGGGEPPVGLPSWVGELGPEIFVPKQAGTIIPAATSAHLAHSQQAADTVIYMDDDRPILIDGNEIGRLVDRRVAKLMGTMVGT